MDQKTIRLEVKDADRGQVRAVVSTYNVIDKDGDVTLPGAFEEGATVPISAYGHKSWEGALPVGLATLKSGARAAVAEGQFFMDTTHGRDTFTTVKELAAQGLGEWSYGYDPVKYSFGEHEGQQVRFLEQVKVHEVSPVLLGAGVDTRTLSAKGGTIGAVGAGTTPSNSNVSVAVSTGDPAPAPSYKHAIRPHGAALTDQRWDPAAMVAGLKGGANVEVLRCVFAYCKGDPTEPASYSYPHHHGPDGPANVRALVMGIAELNSKGAAEMPEEDRVAVYEHLAGHLRDADLEPPALRAPGSAPKQIDRVASLLAECSSVLAEVREVGSSRAGRGKSPLSTLTLKVLGWHRDDLAALDAAIGEMLATPQEEITREFARYLRAQALTL